MKARTELLLYQLLWLGEQAAYPTFRKLSTSFESWAYTKGLIQAINRLEHKQLLETQGRSLDRVVRLTEKGQQLLIGNRNPENEWARDWDGTWNMVIFDIPESERSLRRKLRDVLRTNHFGCFQQSVWLSPHSLDSINESIRKATPGLGSLTLMESRLLSGQNNIDAAKSAWNFSHINSNYKAYIKHINLFGSKSHPKNTDNFIAKEKLLWETALSHDPLLPKQLIPRGYMGEKAYRLRKRKLPRIMDTIFKHHLKISA